MKRIDFYVQHLLRHGADQAVLVSGQPVTFRFARGERRSNVAIDHAQVANLVQESAPPGLIEELRTRGKGTFEHLCDGVTVRVRIEVRAAREWEVTLAAIDGAAGAVRADAPPPKAESEARPVRRPSKRPSLSRQRAAKESKPDAQPPARRAKVEAPAEPPSAQPAARAAAPLPGEPAINRMLRRMVEIGASDLHLATGVIPMVRLHGEMQPLEERAAFTEEELGPLLLEVLPGRNRKEFDETSDTDFAHMIPDVARFRGNYYRDRRGICACFRQIPFEILSAEKLGLPLQVLDLCYLTKGLVLVTGPTGSGKSTTLATLVDIVNQKRADHIVTIEDPIEFVHKNKRCLVNQREVGTHTESFKRALRAALREDPDVVLVGELRDLETIAIAIETAETGHLVFGTLHTTSAPSTVDRIIDQFPADRQEQIRTMLSESLRGVIAQMLCKRRGGGRVAAYEVLIANNAVANLIREGKTYQLVSVMQTGKALGMQTMNEHLFHHVQNEVITPEEGFMKSNDKTGFKELLRRAGFDLRLE